MCIQVIFNPREIKQALRAVACLGARATAGCQGRALHPPHVRLARAGLLYRGLLTHAHLKRDAKHRVSLKTVPFIPQGSSLSGRERLYITRCALNYLLTLCELTVGEYYNKNKLINILHK